MNTRRTTQDEASRLQALRSLSILDTDPEERYDRFTRVAKRMFDVPIALISLVDEHRQWFKSAVGLSVRETSRDNSFSSHTIHSDRVMVVDDATLDERFVNNPLVTGNSKIRFYAGCPLRAPDGSNVGTLCIMDYETRNFELVQLEALVDLAGRVERELASVELVTIDKLTGISDQDGFLTLAKNSLGVCARLKRPATLVVVDLNEFKSINLVHGREEGDRVLRGIARKVRRTFRNTDVFGRIGEDEFAGLLTSTSYESARDLVGNFRNSIEKLIVEEKLNYDLPFTEAIVTVQHENDYELDGLLGRARRMMEVKKMARLGKQSLQETGSQEAPFNNSISEPSSSACSPG